MRKIFLAAVAITPLLGGAAFANISHTNTDPGNIGGPTVLYLGNQAFYSGMSQPRQSDTAQRQMPQKNPSGETTHPVSPNEG